MKKKISTVIIVIVVISAYLFLTKNPTQLTAPPPPAQVKDVPDNWDIYREANKKSIAEHIAKHKDDYFGFAYFSVSQTDGIPYIILNLLPKIAPEFWGDEDNFLSVMGLYRDPRMGNYPMPSGIGLSALGREDLLSDIDYASFTCGGCHIGRVRLEDGNFQYLDGGINSEFNVVLYRKKIVETLNKIYAGETDKAKQKQLVVDAILTALEKVQRNDENYFYKNYRYKDKVFDAKYEKAQIELFKKDAKTYIANFIAQQENVYAGWELIADRNYKEIAERTKSGFAGMEDAISFNAVHAYQGLKDKWYTAPFSHLPLPDVAAVTDIMAVWNQQTRDPLGWNESEDLLINGGGQWNGHIPMLFYKNFAAQATLGFENNDVRVSAHAERLLNKLPSPAYPFNVDVDLAKKGKEIFTKNCADCHQNNNGRVYKYEDISTHQGRAVIAGTVITLGAQSGFSSSCGPDTEVVLSGEKVKPCAEYKGVSLKGKKNQIMTNPKQHDGYNALPLVGIWAQAPYLHNGSVPTLYHMLVPSERPDEFIKSRLDYDQEKLGFRWQKPESPDEPLTEGYLYDTSSSPIIGLQGHDKNITLDGKNYQLVWEDDKAGRDALLEYLKTL